MKINHKFLSLPPYISTSWNNISALHMKGSTLVITLHDGDTINVPGLENNIVESIFIAHTTHLENEPSPSAVAQQKKLVNPFTQALLDPQQAQEFPFRFGFSTADGIGTVLQHNPEQAGAPDMPKEILDKISAIAKIVSPGDAVLGPKPEPHCNCMHCQIARAVSKAAEDVEQEELVAEEPISEEELQFQQWEINQSGEKLFTVVNKLDTRERYSVYLGHPVGCTCGKGGCEHILAVLKS